ncbi:MAG: hypothetical protein FJZ56_03540 [Chlamydiae bacterium]|nr:hypothetical protein [Chlamydiota bacterium]
MAKAPKNPDLEELVDGAAPQIQKKNRRQVEFDLPKKSKKLGKKWSAREIFLIRTLFNHYQ